MVLYHDTKILFLYVGNSVKVFDLSRQDETPKAEFNIAPNLDNVTLGAILKQVSEMKGKRS